MNRHFFGRSDGEARLRYLDADYQVVVPGSYVTCAVTERRIPLSELRYWSVDRQEAYADAAASLKREMALRRPRSEAPPKPRPGRARLGDIWRWLSRRSHPQ